MIISCRNVEKAHKPLIKMRKLKKGLWILLSEKATLSTATTWYPLQDMTLKCKIPDSVVGTMSWTVNDQVIQQNDKFSFSQDGTVLTVKSVTEKDKGESHVSLLYQ